MKQRYLSDIKLQNYRSYEKSYTLSLRQWHSHANPCLCLDNQTLLHTRCKFLPVSKTQNTMNIPGTESYIS